MEKSTWLFGHFISVLGCVCIIHYKNFTRNVCTRNVEHTRILMTQCKTEEIPVLMHWRYSLCHRYIHCDIIASDILVLTASCKSGVTPVHQCTSNAVLLYPRPTKLEGGYTGFTSSVCPSVRLSVRPSVCRRHGFRSISQVCFGISISNFICMFMVAIGRSLLIFSDVTFKMAAWRPYWIFWFPDFNFTLALNINFKLQRHNTYVYG